MAEKKTLDAAGHEIKPGNYWVCIIGPVNGGELPPGSDAPMRSGVQCAFYALTRHDEGVCYSGWGNNEEMVKRILEIEPEEPDGD